MRDFLDKVIDFCEEKNKNDWHNTTLFFPNNRSGYYFREKLKKRLAVGSFLPSIQTLEGFVKDHTTLQFINNTDVIFELYKEYKTHFPDTSLKNFLPVAKTLMADFNELNSELLDVKLFFRNLDQLKSMNVFMEEDHEKAYKYKYFWKTIEQCYLALERFCEEKKAGYTGLIYRNVATQIKEIPIPSKNYFFVGFTQLSAAEREIIQFYLQEKDAHYLIDTDEFYIADIQKTAGISYRKEIKALKLKQPSFVENLIKTEQKEINIYACNGKFEQIQVVQTIIENDEDIKQSPTRTAVILPDATLLHPLLTQLPKEYSDANISMGWGMNHSLVYRNIVAIQQCFHYKKQFGDSNYFHVNNLKTLFELGLVENGNKLSSNLKSEKKTIYVSSKKLAYLIKKNEQLTKLLIETTSLELFKANLYSWLKSLKSCSETEQTFIIDCIGIVNQTNETTDNILWLTIDDYLLLLIDALASNQLPFNVDPTKGLQIMGVMESRSLDFENVIILSMNEGTFPPSSNANSYIPYELRMAYLTPPIEKDAISTYLFYRLLHRAKKIHLLYNSQDKFAGGELSRYILQSRFELSKLPNITVNEFNVSSGISSPEITDTTINKDNKVQEAIKYYFQNKGISVSALKKYINCSLQFYYSYILKIRPIDEADENIESDLLGSAIHHVLDILYRPFIGKEIHLSDIEPLLKSDTIEHLLREYLAENFDSNLIVGKNYLLVKVAVKLIRMFLMNESKLLQNSKLRILALEEEVKVDIEINGINVLFQGYIDRIDEVDKTIRIADYKTGRVKTIDLKSADLDAIFTDPKHEKVFQLLMYAWMYKKTNNSISELVSGIYWLKKAEENFFSVTIDKNELLTSDLFDFFEDKISNLITSIQNPAIGFEMTQEIKRCEFCDYKNLCNRN